jgi:hypothetical protein
MAHVAHRRSIVAALACIVLFRSTAANAQDPGRVGVVVGYPSSIGVEWQVSNPIAVRPALSFKNAHTEGPGVLSADAHDLTAALSVLWCVRRADHVDFYVAPRIAYLRTTTELNSSFDITSVSPILGSLPIAASSEIKTTGYEAAGLVGARYTAGRHFSLFGESGIAYSHTSHDEGAVILLLGNSGTKITNHSWSTTAGVGAVVWF